MDAAGDATNEDAPPDGAEERVEQCGQDMERISDGPHPFCIDRTEVTERAYASFLASGPTSWVQAPECQWNLRFEPRLDWPPAVLSERPVVWIDWCDAIAFCAWASKHLCGRIGGGSLGFGEFAIAAESEWHHACSRSATRTYPYGDTYQPDTCDGRDYGVNDLIAVATATGCEGGYPGLYDMSGNAREWEASCEADSGADDLCHVRGGSFKQEWSALACGDEYSLQRNDADSRTGFRCCSTP